MNLNRYIKEKSCYIAMFLINKMIGIDREKFYFIGMVGKYNDNSKAVSEKLHERYPKAKIYWTFTKTGSQDPHIPEYIHPVVGLIQQYVHMATSSCWISSGVLRKGVYKSRKQLYVNLWHGDRGFKKVLNDKNPELYKKDRLFTDYCDLVTSGSSFFNDVLRTAFCYDGEVLHTGCPRNDTLFRKDKKLKEKIKKELGIAPTYKILLYAPTFRDHAMYNQQENIDIDKTLLAFEKATSEKWICLGRFHPMTRNRNAFISKNIIDVTNYYDMVDLLYISDAHITDYSSTAGDFVLLNRPVFLFHADKADYQKNDRGFYFRMEDTPFWVASTQEELENLIMTKMQEGAVEENCKAILEFYGATETGHASDDVIDFILNKK